MNEGLTLGYRTKLRNIPGSRLHSEADSFLKSCLKNRLASVISSASLRGYVEGYVAVKSWKSCGRGADYQSLFALRGTSCHSFCPSSNPRALCYWTCSSSRASYLCFASYLADTQRPSGWSEKIAWLPTRSNHFAVRLHE